MASTHHAAAVRPARTARMGFDRQGFGAVAITLFVLLIVAGPSLPSMTLAAAGVSLLAIGFTMAVVLWALRKPISSEAGAWDAAGLFVFLGFAAAIMCGAEAFLV